MPLRNLFLRDEAQEAAERTTLAYHMDRLGVSEHATQRFALKINL